MDCPKCDGTLAAKTFGEVEYDQCGRCKGLWFDIQEHEDLKKLAGSRKIDSGEAAKGAELSSKDKYECPKCASVMVRLVGRGKKPFKYESCGACYGVFFDAGEFKAFNPSTIKDLVAGLFGR